MPLLALTKYRGNPLAVSVYGKAVAWWELDETASPPVSLKDHVNLHHDARYDFIFKGGGGVAQGNASLRSGGTACMLFPLTTGNILFNGGDAISEITGTMNHSVISWCKPSNNTSTNFRTFIDGFNNTTINSTGNRQFCIGLSAAGRPDSIWMYGTHTNEATGSGSLLTAATTYFIGYSKTVSGKRVDHYINGALSVTRTYVNEPTGGSAQVQALGGTYFLSGSQLGGADSYLQGIAVFNDALTAAEHSYLYNAGAGKSWEQVKTEAGH